VGKASVNVDGFAVGANFTDALPLRLIFLIREIREINTPVREDQHVFPSPCPYDAYFCIWEIRGINAREPMSRMSPSPNRIGIVYKPVFLASSTVLLYLIFNPYTIDW
jgi:hypothetical protein